MARLAHSLYALILSLPLPAGALDHKCLPAKDNSSAFASPLFTSYNSVGVCVRWYCWLDEFTPQFPTAVQKNQYCGTYSEMSKVGSRLQTIQKAADPLKSLNEAGKRFPIVPLSDPSMQGMPVQ